MFSCDKRDRDKDVINIMKLVLRKFYFDDEECIGYDELQHKIKDWLCEEIGDDEFVRFCEEEVKD